LRYRIVISDDMSRWLAIFAFFLAFAGGAAAAEPPSAVTLAKHGETFVVDATVDFPVDLHVAWGVLTDFDHMTDVLHDVDSSQVVSRSGDVLVVRQHGHANYGPFSYSFASEREVTLAPMTSIIARQLSGNAKSYLSEMHLVETADGTTCRYHAEIIPDSAIARMFGGHFLKHEVEQHFVEMLGEMLRRKAQ
jgi:hypothetical protein